MLEPLRLCVKITTGSKYPEPVQTTYIITDTEPFFLWCSNVFQILSWAQNHLNYRKKGYKTTKKNMDGIWCRRRGSKGTEKKAAEKVKKTRKKRIGNQKNSRSLDMISRKSPICTVPKQSKPNPRWTSRYIKQEKKKAKRSAQMKRANRKVETPCSSLSADPTCPWVRHAHFNLFMRARLSSDPSERGRLGI